ncbi:MAG: glycosyltransferase, partial [Nitrospinaceae bacterium]|nr:glycosyltransferase family 4 protein [Nitrospinaceae bacterium]NIR56728.1 glycosyltransferase family 4 protein [Nitrospinaceae bacterium]NIS87177.1 glycosyltransferase family 4 protein [Nitrospinaceae bacterium]NIT84046.1 glycosyltransferase family 4 protein [Nitrospinaceae bacterium]NIU46229.1 glycosyltransferase family 4 protein [Nitrospinaceae bacterium]
MNAPSPASVDAVPDLRRDPKSPDSLRILVVATTFPRWKNDHEPRFVFDLCRHLAKKVPLWVLAPHAGGAAFEEEIEGVRVIRFPYFYPRPLQTLCYGGGILPNLKSRWTARFQVPFFLAAQGFFLWKTVRRLQVNLIHCHWIVPQGFFTAWIHVFLRIPYLLTAHGGDVYAFQGHPLVRPLSRFALKRAGMCTVGSRASQKAIR